MRYAFDRAVQFVQIDIVQIVEKLTGISKECGVTSCALIAFEKGEKSVSDKWKKSSIASSPTVYSSSFDP